MKNAVLQFIKPSLILILMFSVLSCSNDKLEEEVLESYDFKIEKAETVEDQLEMLTKAMRRFHNFDVAVDQGYVAVSPLVEGMGIHYAKFEYVDMNFEILKPEILVYHPDENGVMQFVAAEYLIPVKNCGLEEDHTPPTDRFLGDQDHWRLNCTAGGWTLHAWVGLENPDGVFAPYNPKLQ
ncbi:hypothetical protein [Christiangramia sp. SM2212]|uniref:Uncharacterized protein n=1 Tax=Christiangramia sediminicola TaxID=3073267 RepID=A0ABU1EMI1_9FLAO|nr:hypothetical protein [Christiangramia sp. SM2212]MDR5589373.1 hypothetical protein [Christiangramia sp. SM2212]